MTTSNRFPPPVPSLNVAAILKHYGLRPKKRLGQNFLQDPSILQKIADIAQIRPTDTVLEIGPGLGSLTRHLAAVAEQVIAIELDNRLFQPLEKIIEPYPNIQLIHGDILKVDPVEILNKPEYLVVANIPYYITSAVIRHLLESDLKPRRIVLTIQQEVAQRICAGPGNMSLLALSVQVFGQPQIVAHIPAGAFFPVPKVASSILLVDIAPIPAIPAQQLDKFFQLIKAGFSQKRKTLRNSLSAGLRVSAQEAEDMLRRAEIDPMRRAETLSLDQWGKLCENYP
jgi:16S rRNA (adenine1518-N6/adenine1519-N6)-dimethyltransferase